MSEYYHVDDAAAAALFRLANAPTEQLGALYSQDGGIRRSSTVGGNGQHVKGSLAVPAGSLRALFHNHPAAKGADAERAKFSPDDKAQARRLSAPSYISAGDRVRRFDPRNGTTEDVLAQFPINEWRSHIMQRLLGRSPDDPRGAIR